MLSEAGKVARKKHMTRSELMRVALREYIEKHSAMEAVHIYKKELREGKLKTLRGSLTDLMRS